MSSSILNSTKKMLDISEEDDSFDGTIIMHINSVFAELDQIGVGPTGGFMIEDAAATWESYIGTDLRYNMVKSHMYLSVRLLFDPPATSFGIAAIEKQIEKSTWRLNVLRESHRYVDSNPTGGSTTPISSDQLYVFVGGDAEGA